MAVKFEKNSGRLFLFKTFLDFLWKVRNRASFPDEKYIAKLNQEDLRVTEKYRFYAFMAQEYFGNMGTRSYENFLSGAPVADNRMIEFCEKFIETFNNLSDEKKKDFRGLEVAFYEWRNELYREFGWTDMSQEISEEVRDNKPLDLTNEEEFKDALEKFDKYYSSLSVNQLTQTEEHFFKKWKDIALNKFRNPEIVSAPMSENSKDSGDARVYEQSFLNRTWGIYHYFQGKAIYRRLNFYPSVSHSEKNNKEVFYDVEISALHDGVDILGSCCYSIKNCTLDIQFETKKLLILLNKWSIGHNKQFGLGRISFWDKQKNAIESKVAVFEEESDEKRSLFESGHPITEFMNPDILFFLNDWEKRSLSLPDILLLHDAKILTWTLKEYNQD